MSSAAFIGGRFKFRQRGDVKLITVEYSEITLYNAYMSQYSTEETIMIIQI